MASADAPLWRTPRYGPAPPARDDASSSAHANEMLPATPTRRKLVPPPPPPFSGRADAAVRASGQLADYELGEVLGSGGFGQVRAGRDVRTGVCVAVKIVDKRKMAEAGITDRIMNEVRLHSRPGRRN
jgi:serine/threonine protein kinase